MSFFGKHTSRRVKSHHSSISPVKSPSDMPVMRTLTKVPAGITPAAVRAPSRQCPGGVGVGPARVAPSALSKPSHSTSITVPSRSSLYSSMTGGDPPPVPPAGRGVRVHLASHGGGQGPLLRGRTEDAGPLDALLPQEVAQLLKLRAPRRAVRRSGRCAAPRQAWPSAAWRTAPRSPPWCSGGA